MNRLSCMLACLAAMLVLPSMARADMVWKVSGGDTAIFFFESILQVNGIDLADLKATGVDPELMSNSVAFKVLPSSTLKYRTRNGVFVGYEGGELQHEGGFELRNKLGNIPMTGFTLRPNGAGAPQGAHLFVGANPNTPFRLEMVQPFLIMYYGKAYIGCSDLVISREYAMQVGRPDWADLLIGTIASVCDVELVYSDGRDLERRDATMQGGVIDLGLSAMSNLSSVGRTGTFPNGVSGLAMSTTSCNYGTVDIMWNQPMAETHPVIVQNLYRIYQGRFEQIGWAWLKHGFLSTNSGGCGSCQHPGTGTLLGPGCSDTYGTGNNSDPRWLGPREEVNPFTGRWTCRNSYFSGYVNDCVRRNNGTGIGPVAHRMEVLDSDLNVTGAGFYYEAYYINEGESNKYNQIGYRRATPSWSGSQWTFTTNTAMTHGPAINIWGDMRATALPRTDGDAIVAVATTSLGGGNFHYEYAVYIHDIDRQIREFIIPVEAGMNVANIGFRDVDLDANNQWQSEYSNGRIRWWCETYDQNPNANTLKYGRVFNFWFDVNSGPVASAVTLGLFKPGTLPSIEAAVNGPMPPSPAQMSGTVELQDYVGTPVPVTFTLTPTNGGPSTTVPGVNLGAGGTFQFTTTVRGNYEVYAKASHWLRKKRIGAVDITASGVSGLTFSLINGDINGDNVIDIGDFAIFSAAYGTVPGDAGWNPLADLNGDDEVDMGDFAILSANFDTQGD